MKVAILIPTYKRFEKLTKCLNSLSVQSYKDFEVFIYADNNDTSTRDLLRVNERDNFKIHVVVNEKQLYAPGSWNKAFKDLHNKFDAFLWLVDDAELYSNGLEEAVNSMKKNFPDNDGVVGLHQVCEGFDNYTFKYFGQVLIGNKFVERYKNVDYKVCCPYYTFLYQDEELYQFANSLNKFVECQDAILNHNHPAFTQDFDETHFLSRKNEIRSADRIMFIDRQKKGYIWGKTWFQ